MDTISRAGQIIEKDLFFMGLAIEEARKAFGDGEAPVGAVAVKDGNIIARARNMKESRSDPTSHAEIELLKQVASMLGGWRLTGVTVYVTLEPCPMCAGGMVLARIDRLVYGAPDPKMGAVRTLYRIADDPRLNHRIEVTEGVMAKECGDILTSFFKLKRA